MDDKLDRILSNEQYLMEVVHRRPQSTKSSTCIYIKSHKIISNYMYPNNKTHFPYCDFKQSAKNTLLIVSMVSFIDPLVNKTTTKNVTS